MATATAAPAARPAAAGARQGPALRLRWRDVVAAGGMGLLVAVGVAGRVLSLQGGALNADEAVNGLMALHIAAGREAPVFYYGQQYFGALEAYLTAGVIKVLGFRPWLLYVVPICASAALIPLTAALARRLTGEPAGWGRAATGWLAALPVAAATPIMARMLAHGGGGFALAFALHAAALYCYVRAYTRPSVRWAAAFSLVAGFLCWVWQPALLLCGVLYLALFARRPALLHPRRVVLVVLPLFVGLLPPLTYNVARDFPTLAEVARKFSTPPDQAPAAITQNKWVVAILLGMAMGGGEDTYGGTNWPQAVAVAAAVAGTLLVIAARGASRLARRPALRRNNPDASTTVDIAPGTGMQPASGAVGAVGAVAAILTLAVVADVVAAHGAVRHLHPAAFTAFAFFGALPAVLFGAGTDAWRRASRIGLSIVMALVVVPNAFVQVSTAGELGERMMFGAELAAVVDGLESRGLTRGYSDYWGAYPVTYWSGERIVVAPIAAMTYGGRFERYPAYTELVNQDLTFRGLFLLLEAACQMAPYTAYLDERGAAYRVEPLGGYQVLWDVRVAPAVQRETVEVWRALIAGRDVC